MAEAAKKKKIFDGRYEVLSIVGRGAASVVYHARHVGAITSEVALKVLMKQPAREDNKATNSDLLRKEALAMVSARHKYVVRLDDFHSIGDLCYLAMEFALLGDMRKFTQNKGGKLAPALGEVFLAQVAEGLDFVHRVGIVHRDIKPDNILIMSEKDIRLADFGVAVLPGEASSIKDLQAGVGTMSYMAPEVLEGISYDKRSDIYSLGVSFYEMFSGIHPFEKAPLIKQLEVRADQNIPPLHVLVPEIPKHISTVIMQAMSYDPAHRFASCQDLLQSLGVNRSQAAKPAQLVDKKPLADAPVKPTTLSVSSPQNDQKAPSTLATQESAPESSSHYSIVENASNTKPIPSGIAESSPPIDRTMRSDKPPAPVVDLPEKPITRSAPAAKAQPEVSPAIATPVPEGTTPTPPLHPAIENRKPKRSLEDLRRLARESKTPATSTAGAKPLASPFARTPRQSSISGIKPVIVAILVGAFLYAAYQYFLMNKESARPLPEPKNITSPIPTTSPESLSFPELSSGVFHGSVENFITDTPVPLSLVSLGPARGIVVILGIPGWTPQIVQPEGGTDSIRVASNGFIIDLRGTVKGEKVQGQISNLVTGEKSSWFAERVSR